MADMPSVVRFMFPGVSGQDDARRGGRCARRRCCPPGPAGTRRASERIDSAEATAPNVAPMRSTRGRRGGGGTGWARGLAIAVAVAIRPRPPRREAPVRRAGVVGTGASEVTAGGEAGGPLERVPGPRIVLGLLRPAGEGPQEDQQQDEAGEAEQGVAGGLEDVEGLDRVEVVDGHQLGGAGLAEEAGGQGGDPADGTADEQEQRHEAGAALVEAGAEDLGGPEHHGADGGGDPGDEQQGGDAAGPGGAEQRGGGVAVGEGLDRLDGLHRAGGHAEEGEEQGGDAEQERAAEDELAPLDGGAPEPDEAEQRHRARRSTRRPRGPRRGTASDRRGAGPSRRRRSARRGRR